MRSWNSLPWDNLKTFYRTAQAGNFTRAGEKMNISQSAVSRQIILLEERLKLRLFIRHRGGGPAILTPEGEILYCAVEKITHTLNRSLSDFEEKRYEPKGFLRVSFPASLFTFCFLPALPRFLDRYSDITLKLHFHETTSWPDMTDIDLAIVPFRLYTSSEWIQKPVLSFQCQLYAHPDYLKQYGEIKEIEDLNSHRLIGYSGRFKDILKPLNWPLSVGVSQGRREPFLEVEPFHEALFLAQQGCGLASLPCLFLKDSVGPLVQVLPSIPRPTMDLYLTYEKHLETFKRVEIFANWVQGLTCKAD